MKLRTLSLLAFSACVGSTAANATTYTYDVDFTLAGQTVTGDIVTDCNSCSLSGSDVVSFVFNITGGPLQESNSGNTLSTTPTLSVTPTAIKDKITLGQDIFFGSGGGFVNFGGNAVQYDDQNGQGFTQTYSSPFIVARVPGAVPLPGALPLLATGLSGLGLLGWRRKKKTAPLAG